MTQWVTMASVHPVESCGLLPSDVQALTGPSSSLGKHTRDLPTVTQLEREELGLEPGTCYGEVPSCRQSGLQPPTPRWSV